MSPIQTMFAATVLACTSGATWAQNDEPANAGQPGSDAPGTAQSSTGAARTEADKGLQKNIDRSRTKSANSRRVATDAYANCGDYNVRAANGSPPGASNTNSADRKTARGNNSRTDCVQKK